MRAGINLRNGTSRIEYREIHTGDDKHSTSVVFEDGMTMYVSITVFCTCEFTRLMVLNQVQEMGLAFGRWYGDDAWSSGFSYTGITRIANSACAKTGPRLYNKRSTQNFVPLLTTQPKER